MTPKATGWDELHLAENPAVELLEALGYAYVLPDDLDTERTSFKETILTGRLAAALKRLNPWLSEANVARAEKAVAQVPAASLAEANEKVYTSLTYGIALEQDGATGGRAIRSGSSTSTSLSATSGLSRGSTTCSGRRSTSSRTSSCS